MTLFLEVVPQIVNSFVDVLGFSLEGGFDMSNGGIEMTFHELIEGLGVVLDTFDSLMKVVDFSVKILVTKIEVNVLSEF